MTVKPEDCVHGTECGIHYRQSQSVPELGLYIDYIGASVVVTRLTDDTTWAMFLLAGKRPVDLITSVYKVGDKSIYEMMIELNSDDLSSVVTSSEDCYYPEELVENGTLDDLSKFIENVHKMNCDVVRLTQ